MLYFIIRLRHLKLNEEMEIASLDSPVRHITENKTRTSNYLK